MVLAAAGSSDPEANATIARLAAQWQARAGWFAVRPAYASAAEPSPAAAVAGLLRDGAPRVVVATYLLAPGLFADRIRHVRAGRGRGRRLPRARRLRRGSRRPAGPIRPGGINRRTAA